MSGSPAPVEGSVVHVLIVEDNPPDVYLLRMALTQVCRQCLFHTVETGADAFHFLRREPPFEAAVIPDLVVLDLNLPLKSGEEVLALIRMTEHLANVVVILCSSSPRELSLRSVHRADAYLAKPSDLDSYLALGKDIMECYWSRKGLDKTQIQTTSVAYAPPEPG